MFSFCLATRVRNLLTYVASAIAQNWRTFSFWALLSLFCTENNTSVMQDLRIQNFEIQKKKRCTWPVSDMVRDLKSRSMHFNLCFIVCLCKHRCRNESRDTTTEGEEHLHILTELLQEAQGPQSQGDSHNIRPIIVDAPGKCTALETSS